MSIDDLKIGDIKSLRKLLSCESESASPWEIGKIYLIRTVTMIQLGRLISVHPHELVLEDASWIADTGRFSDALKTCEFSEIEPFPDGRVIVGRGAVIDAAIVSKVCREKK